MSSCIIRSLPGSRGEADASDGAGIKVKDVKGLIL